MKFFYFSLLFISTSLFANETLQSRAVIHSIDKTTISSEIAGEIIFMQKNNGDFFEKNETLVKVNCDIYMAQKNKIRATRDLAKVKLDKTMHLNSFNSAGQFDVKTAEFELQEQEYELKVASINVERCEIKAPFSGRVVEKKVNKYQNIKPQDELYEIVNNNALEIRAIVPAIWLSWLEIGEEINMNIDELNTNIKSKIIQIDSVVDPKSQTISIRAKIDNPKNIIAGMSGTVTFLRKAE